MLLAGDCHPPDHPRMRHTVVVVDPGGIQRDGFRLARADLTRVPGLLRIGGRVDDVAVVDPIEGGAYRHLHASRLEAIVVHPDRPVERPRATERRRTADLLTNTHRTA